MDNLQQLLIDTLLQQRKINKKKLRAAQKLTEEKGIPGEQALVMAGVVTREQVFEALSQITGLPTIDLSQVQIKASVAQLIPKDMAQRFQLLCLAKEQGKIITAMVDPGDPFALEYVKMRTGMEVEPRVCFVGDFQPALERAYSIKVEYIGKDTPYKSEDNASSSKTTSKFVVATRSRTPRSSLISRNVITPSSNIPNRSIKIKGLSSPVITSKSDTIPREQALSALLEIGKDLVSTLDTDNLVKKILQSVIDLTQSEGASLILVGDSGNELYFKESIGPKSDEIKRITFPLDEHSVAGYAITNRMALRINDVSQDPRHNKSVDKAIKFETRSLLCVPVTWRGSPLGVITAVNKADNQPFTEEDEEYLTILASHAALAINNSEIVDKLCNFYTETVGLLLDILERFDTISRNHMVEVAQFSTTMGKYLELPPPEMERLCYGGLLHDIGKIFCDDPWDRDHTVKGAMILERVKLFRDLVPLIRHHHECYDGGGFPDRLRGEQIPFLARIIAIAEAWVEGISERGEEAKEELLQELRSDFGYRFDPDLRPAFEYTIQIVW